MTQFSDPSQQQLHHLATSETLRPFVLEPYSMLGCIFGVASAPEIPLPTQWLPWLFKAPVPTQYSEDVDQLADAAMLCLQWQLKNMRDEHVEFMQGLALPAPPYKDGHLSFWLQGLLLAHSQLDSTWQKAWQAMLNTSSKDIETLHKDLKYCLGMFSTFADIPFALQQAKSKGNDKLEQNLATIYLSLPDTLRTYVETSGKLVEYLPNQFETFVKD
ncbi:MAG: YecA family protein [Paraglaciecola sp.]|nr:YecA family protein [Paraglaciecola sp.]